MATARHSLHTTHMPRLTLQTALYTLEVELLPMAPNRCILSQGLLQDLLQDSTTSGSSHPPRRQTPRNHGVQKQNGKPHHLTDAEAEDEGEVADEEEDVEAAGQEQHR